ncbi:MAG: PHP domain-containing protein [Clostridiaceae bacterium]|nr:PHP domain-containing protein [Clostridiaceae bacterium]MBW4859938.1 PHP domain-containing protein [Clostridiaceae bacterium]MBW4869632.1 PHP domain-containing protein [Clostridiaceae bacterium]
MIADLHVHTIYSDGLLTPEQVVDLAVKKDLNALAITDHDTTSGIYRAVKRSKLYENFHIIPGMELSCIHEDEEVHILGYFIEYNSINIINLTKKLQYERVIRAKKIIANLNKLGLDITLSEVKAFSGQDIIGRPHIARALIKKGYVKNMNQAFNKFLDKGKPAYVKRYKLTIENAINLIHNIGGIAIIAHPGLIEREEIIYYCIELGVDGMEIIHSKHSREKFLKLMDIANRYDMIKTGGSDCHGKLINGEYLLGNYYINIDTIPKMKGMIKVVNL